MGKTGRASACALLAAALYAVSVPLSKLLLGRVGPAMLAALLYLGAGLGLLLCRGLSRLAGRGGVREPLTKKDLPYTIAMIVLDIAAPILLMLGVSRTAAANVSLLGNFEVAATALIALFLFGEVVSRRLWLAILLVTAASILLGLEGTEGLRFDPGSLLVLGACVCWGFENNCTKKLSHRSPMQVVTVKGCFSGLGSLVVALAVGEGLPALPVIGAALVLGFLSYGLSICCYIYAQRELGAAKTGAWYAAAPFMGAGLGLLLLGERPGPLFWPALLLMAGGTALMLADPVALQHLHRHSHIHTHEHRHGDLVHSHEHVHTHSHEHIHGANADDHGHVHADLPDHGHVHGGC